MKNLAKKIYVLLLICTTSTFAHATLIDNGDGTVTQIKDDPIYGDGSVLMWLKNSNAAAGSVFDDGPDLTDGRLTYDNAQAWIHNLNSINYLGYSDWRLPINLPVDGSVHSGVSSFDGSTWKGI